MASAAPRLLAAFAALAVALCTSARAAARSCIGHAYERMQIELAGVYRGDAEVPRPPELQNLDELLNSGAQGQGALLWEKATLGFAKFYQLTEPKEPTPKVGRYLRAASQRKLMTSCGYAVSYTPILPGRYAFDQEHRDGAKVPVGIDDPEIIVAPGRDKIELRFSLKGLRYRAVYLVKCAAFEWEGGAQRCAESEPSAIDTPVKPDAAPPPDAAAPPPAEPAPAPPRPVEVSSHPAPAPPPVQPPPGGCGGCAASAGPSARPALLFAAMLALLVNRWTRRRARSGQD